MLSAQDKLVALRSNLKQVIRGKDESIELLLVALLAGGSVLMEDVPGVGKTTLAKALAKSIDANYSRIQFTPDLLPADILGSSVYSPVSGEFTFRAGPIFCNILLADEINRASPRTQSALLEAMSERQATIEGRLYKLEEPFLVIATQNPVEYHGTYPLPEAQLDRFLMQLDLGYPDAAAEVGILFSQVNHHPLEDIVSVLHRDDILELHRAVMAVTVDKSLGVYIVELANQTRRDERLRLGVSPRASLMLFRAAQASALIGGRNYVLPDDIQGLAPVVLAHRLMLTSKARYAGITKREVVIDILGKVRVPT
jgi:MoxR-like ATPase